MKPHLQKLLEGNSRFVTERLQKNSQVFQDSARAQHPAVLWIGCSDSRIDPNEITQTGIGDLFVHRNIANLVVEYDINFLSVLQYAVEVLKVSDIVICGHYGCGGVQAALKGDQLGLIDAWLGHIKGAYQYYQWELDEVVNERDKARRLVELNVLEQLNNLGKTRIVREAWDKDQSLSLNGWVYDLETGKLNVLLPSIDDAAALKAACKFERKTAHLNTNR